MHQKEKGQGSNSTLLQLPAPENAAGYLAAAVSQSGNELVTTEVISALAVQVEEDIGTGAISKAGALPDHAHQGWVKFAEDKLKRDAQLDYQVGGIHLFLKSSSSSFIYNISYDYLPYDI